jgi:nucleoredoxin
MENLTVSTGIGAGTGTNSNFLGKKFINNKFEEVTAENSILKAKFLALFFTGSWCPPCQLLSQDLITLYNEANNKEKNFEIIQISNEKNEKDFKDSIADKPWLFIPYNDPLIMSLVTDYKISYLPVLIIINKERIVLTDNGRKDVTNFKNKAYDEWFRLYKEHRERDKERQEKLINI